MANRTDQAQQDLVIHPLPDADHLKGSKQSAAELPAPTGDFTIHRSLEDTDLIVQEHDSLLHADKQLAPISDVPKHVPWFAWALLAASLVAVASAAVVFASMKDVPTFALAAWRLQLTTGLLTPAAVYQYKKLSPGTLCPSCNFTITSTLGHDNQPCVDPSKLRFCGFHKHQLYHVLLLTHKHTVQRTS